MSKKTAIWFVVFAVASFANAFGGFPWSIPFLLISGFAMGSWRLLADHEQ